LAANLRKCRHFREHKKLGLTLVSEKVGDERVYRMVSRDAQQPVKTKSARRAA
jgi:hypothetical protein